MNMVYLEPRSDEDLLNDIGDFKRIGIVGCPQCANLSFALRNDLPCYKITPAGIKAVSTRDKIDALLESLRARGMDVKFWLPNFPFGICSLNAIKRKQLSKACRDVDVVISLTCEGGKKNIEDILGGTPVTDGMNAKGLIVSTTKVDLWRREITLNKEKIFIKRFVFEEEKGVKS